MRLNFKIGLFVLLSVLCSCKVGRYVIYNFADIRDHKKFPAREIEKAESVFEFPTALAPKAPKEITVDGKTYPFEEFLATNKSVALLIIHKDSIHFEEYWRNYSEESIVPSFSMAKSVLSILVGCAIEDGLIPSVDIPVTKYIPELKGKGFDKVSIEQVLQMTSGLDYKESYTNPFGDAATFYYGRDLRKAIFNMELEVEPGTRFSYQSGNPQILGLVLDRALGDKTISDYMEEKLWKPLEMEYNASWSLDKKKNGLEKTFCCLNARARDFAKIGRLYLHGGRFKDKQIVPEEWVKKSTQIDTTEASAWYYQYQWWLPSREGDFMAQGILGQYIYVNPAKDLVIVRLGKSTNNMGWSQIFRGIAAAY